jgi:hypothetical protein
MNWSIEEKGARSQKHVNGAMSPIEVHGPKLLNPDFLHEPAEQLFFANAFAAMPRAILSCWNRYAQTPAS